jgi:cell wall-associated NlpC family hydrolase
MTRADFLAELLTWQGTPWQHQQACKGAGADCLGFIAGAAANVGSKEARTFLDSTKLRSYGRLPDPARLFEGADSLMDPIKLEDAEPGDVVVFNVAGHPMHFGVLMPDDRLLHNWTSARKVVLHHFGPSWRKRVAKVYRIRGWDA